MKCDHPREEWTGHSKEIEINLFLIPKGTPAGTLGVHALSYAVAEVSCKKCGQQIARRSIIVKPEDLEIPFVPTQLS